MILYFRIATFNINYIMDSQKYEPLACPPDFAMAKQHRKASMVFDQAVQESIILCPCCKRTSRPKLLDLWTSTKDLIFLGEQIPLYFYYIQIIFWLILVNIFIASGLVVSCLGSLGNCSTINLRIPYKLNPGDTSYLLDVFIGYGDYSGIEYIHLVLLGAYILVFFVLQIRQKSKALEISKNFVCYSNFSIKLDNVSKKATREDVRKLFAKLGYAEVRDERIVFVKKIEEFMNLLQKSKKLKKQAYLLQKQQNKLQLKLTMLDIAALDKQIKQYKHKPDQDINYRTEVAFVTFDSEKRKEQCLQRFQITGLLKGWYKMCACCSPVSIKGQHISLEDAPGPKDIIWENMQKSYTRTKIKRFFSYIFSFFIVVAVSILIFVLSLDNVVSQIQNAFGGSGSGSTIIGLIVSLLIQVSNYLLIQFLQWSTYKVEDHMTYTRAKRSYVKKLTLFLFINTTILPFSIFTYQIVGLKGNSGDALQQLIFNVAFIIAGNVAKPIILFLSLDRIIAYFKRHSERKKGKQSLLSQYDANKLFQPTEFPIQVLYSILMASLFKTFFFLATFPSVIIPEFIMTSLILIVSRYVLFKRSKMPRRFTQELNKTVNKMTQLSIILYWVGRIAFKLVYNYSSKNDQFNVLKTIFSDMYMQIEAAVVLSYFIFVVLFDFDQRIAQWLCYSKKKPNEEEMQQRLDLEFNYANSNSVYRLIEDTPDYEPPKKIEKKKKQEQKPIDYTKRLEEQKIKLLVNRQQSEQKLIKVKLKQKK